MVDYNEIWVVPAANPDGPAWSSWSEPPYGGFAILSAQNAPITVTIATGNQIAWWPPTSYEQYGIDLNRNPRKLRLRAHQDQARIRAAADL